MNTLKELKLLENRILIKKVSDKEGGIEIPEDAGANLIHHFKGVVVCIGPECKIVKENDNVIFRDGYNKMELEGQEYYVLREGNVVGIMNKDHA